MTHDRRADLLRRRGELIATLRGNSPQESHARRAGVHQTTWSGWELGRHDMTVAKALVVAPILGVTVGELLSGELADHADHSASREAESPAGLAS